MEEKTRIITERLVKQGEAEKEFDREFWRKAGHEARFDAARQMVVESFLIQGKDPAELKLQRTVERFFKRERR